MSNLTKHTGEGTAIAREGVAGKEIERRHETATSLESTSARAEIEARYTVAMMHPRDEDQVRAKLLKSCADPVFARAAFYAVPRKGLKKPGAITGTRDVVEGLSVRFAEEAVRKSGNILTRSRTTYDDDSKRKVTVGTCDLETNAIYEDDVLIDKTIERSEPKEGQVVLGSRKNSAGVDVFILQATEEEIRQKQGALVNRARRNLQLALIPAGLLDECKKTIAATVKDSAAKDPDAERKAIADAFASLNVEPVDLKTFLGHELAQSSPAELVTLRGLYAAIRDGEVTWADVVREKAEEAAKAATEEPKTAGGKVAEKIRAKAARVASATAKAATPASSAAPAPAAATGAPAASPATGGGTAPPGPEPSPAAPAEKCAACGSALEGSSCPSCGWVKGERVPE